MVSKTYFLLPAKYKNIPFKIRKESIDGIVQKNIIHGYPNSSSQYIERQGKKPFSATLDIFFSGDTWKDDFNSFKNALNNPAPGRLVLPTFGVFNNIVAIEATASADQTNIGEISIPVTFTETIEKPSPTESDSTSEDVNSAGADSRSDLQSSFEGNYQSPSGIENLTTAKIDFINLAGIINSVTGLTFAAALFARNLPKRLTSPAGMGALLLSPIAPIGFLQTIAKQNNSKSFYNFSKIAVCGNNLPNSMNDIRDGQIPKPFIMPDSRTYISKKIDTTINIWGNETVIRRQRNINRYCAINVIRLCGLISMMENAARRIYNTTVEIDSIINLLDLYYRELIENDISGVIVPDMKPSIDKVKILTDSVLSKKRQNAFNVVEINVERPYSSKLLTYELYGEYIKNEAQLNSVSELIRGLNKSLPAHAMQGTVKVLELR